MTLGEKQRHFTRLISMLIDWAYANGFELTFGDAYRDARVHGAMGEKVGYSSANSNHKQRLACDLNLFINGEYMTATEDYTPLGDYWITLDPLCEWGGSGDRADGNHFSMNHNGQW
jgi:hypothetical protein